MYCIQYILIAQNVALYALLLGTVNNNINITWVALSDKCGVSECVSIDQPMTHQQSFVSKSRCITVLHNCFTTWVYTPKYFHTVWEIISDTKKLFYSTNINPVKLCCWIEYVQRFQVWDWNLQYKVFTLLKVMYYVMYWTTI